MDGLSTDGNMTALVSLRLDGQLDYLRLAWQAGETLLADVPFEQDPKGTRYNILLAMQELLTNVFRHGYQRPAGPPVELRFSVTEQAFEFEIRDQAPEFDPTSRAIVAEAKVEAGEDEMPEKEGGYGLVIVKAIMDGLSYRREDGWNVLTATKYVAAHVGAGIEGEPS